MPGRTAGAEASGDVRILRRVRIAEGSTGEGAESVGQALAVDVETLGLEPDDPVIELAVRPFRFDADGVVTAIGRLRAWREDPGVPVPVKISELTGLRCVDLAGQSINEAEAVSLLRTATFVCAHNAGFDRPRVERRLPGAVGLRWACSIADVDWGTHGMEGRRLGDLLAQAGWFHDGHRAGADVDGVVALLRHRLPHGGTALAELIANARKPSWLVRAVGAPFSAKDTLRTRGYRWDTVRRSWWREVGDDVREDEDRWLAQDVYVLGGAPVWRARDWSDRYG